jgi:transposase
VRVAPKLMGASRRGEREPGKSNQIDARAIARAVLCKGVKRFPVAFLDREAAEIRLLCDHRNTLVSERTRLINRLRINLVVLDPELEAKIPARKMDYPGQLQRISRGLRAMPQTARVRIAREQVKRIAVLAREAEALKRELRDLVRQHRPELLAETGCGPLCAAILIGQTAGAQRFKSDAQLARVAGVAPIPVSSGRQDRHRLDRGGNSQLNRALHVIAITRGRIDPQTHAHLQRKKLKARAASRPCAASSATSHARTIGCSVKDRDQRVLSAWRAHRSKVHDSQRASACSSSEQRSAAGCVRCPLSSGEELFEPGWEEPTEVNANRGGRLMTENDRPRRQVAGTYLASHEL